MFINENQKKYLNHKNMRPLRIGLVGCGRISKVHLKTINKIKTHFKLISVCDTNKQRSLTAGQNYKVRNYYNLKKMLKNENLDIVSVCTPSGYHFEDSMEIAKKNINVITEKPMAILSEHGNEMIREFKKRKLKLFVVKQNRNNPSIKVIKKAIEKKRFGKIHMINANVFWTRKQEYYDLDDWRGTKKYDGGALMNQASHFVDLLTWLNGPVKSVFAQKYKFRNIECEDTATVNIKWKNGAIGTLNVTMLTYPKNFEGSIIVIGEKGLAKVGGIALNKIECWEFEKKIKEDKNINKLSYDTSSVYGKGHLDFYINVYDSITKKIKINTDGNEGFKSLNFINSCYESFKKKKIIEIN